jgi:hypothetical protein
MRLVYESFRVETSVTIMGRGGQILLKYRDFTVFSRSKKVAASLWGKAGRARTGLGRGGVGM